MVKPTEAGEKALRFGQWNEIQFSVIGSHVVTHVNGVKAVDYTDTAPKYFDV